MKLWPQYEATMVLTDGTASLDESTIVGSPWPWPWNKRFWTRRGAESWTSSIARRPEVLLMGLTALQVTGKYVRVSYEVRRAA